MAISGIIRIEEFHNSTAEEDFDPMLSQKYAELNQTIFTIDIAPEAILDIDDIAAYNKQEGLSLSPEEVEYLDNLAVKIGRKLTDSEIFGSRKPIQSTVVTRFSTENLLLMVWKRIFFI
jgi:phosphoribosylformylglycinamidine synthase